MSFSKADLFSERGQYCECGCSLFAHDAHHAFVPNLRRFSEWVNDPRNIVLVNHDEHISRKFDCPEWRRKFWKRQVLRYGQDAMNEWIAAAPAKLDKSRLSFIMEL
jgi:hypothetical protein